MKSIFILLSVFVGNHLLAQQPDVEKRVLSVFEKTAMTYLKEWNKTETDMKRKNLNISSMRLNMTLAKTNVHSAIENGSLAKNQKAIIDFTTAEYKKYLSDLPTAFYEKVNQQFSN